MKLPGTSAGTSHFLKTSTKDLYHGMAIETALKEERMRVARGEPKKAVAASPRGSPRKQPRSSSSRPMSPAMQRLTKPRPRSPTAHEEDPPSPSKTRPSRMSSPAMQRSASPGSPRAASPGGGAKSSWKQRTIAAHDKRAMSPIVRRSGRGSRAGAKLAVSPAPLQAQQQVRRPDPAVSAWEEDDLEEDDRGSAGSRWCKSCSAAFTARRCLRSHPSDQYCAIPWVGATDGVDEEAEEVDIAPQSASAQLSAAMQALADGPASDNADGRAHDALHAQRALAAAMEDSVDSSSDSSSDEPEPEPEPEPVSIQKLAVSALKHAASADSEYKEHQDQEDSTSLLHAVISAYIRAEELLLAATADTETVKESVKATLSSKIEPAGKRRVALERVVEKLKKSSADHVIDARDALSSTTWGVNRLAAEEEAAEVAHAAAELPAPELRAARPEMDMKKFLEEIGADPDGLIGVEDGFLQLEVDTLGDLAELVENITDLEGFDLSDDLIAKAWQEVTLINGLRDGPAAAQVEPSAGSSKTIGGDGSESEDSDDDADEVDQKPAVANPMDAGSSGDNADEDDDDEHAVANPMDAGSSSDDEPEPTPAPPPPEPEEPPKEEDKEEDPFAALASAIAGDDSEDGPEEPAEEAVQRTPATPKSVGSVRVAVVATDVDEPRVREATDTPEAGSDESDDEETVQQPAPQPDRLTKGFSSPPSDRTTIDRTAEAAALAWIGQKLRRPSLADAALESLRDGVVLCELVNTLRPGSVENISSSKMAFHQRVNIQAFISALPSFGVPEAAGFETADLYEEKNSRAVVRCIESVKQAVAAGSGPVMPTKRSAPESQPATRNPAANDSDDSDDGGDGGEQESAPAVPNPMDAGSSSDSDGEAAQSEADATPAVANPMDAGSSSDDDSADQQPVANPMDAGSSSDDDDEPEPAPAPAPSQPEPASEEEDPLAGLENAMNPPEPGSSEEQAAEPPGADAFGDLEALLG